MATDEDANGAAGGARASVLHDSIHRAYAVFRKYKLTRPIVGHPCCMTPPKDDPLIVLPLQSLSGSQLEHYVSRALTTHGTLSDFKHFLPRMLELIAVDGDIGHTDVEIAIGKLGYAKWREWPGKEQQAVGEVLKNIWRSILGRYPSSPNAEAYLCGIGNAEENLDWYLNAWQTDESLAASRHVAHLLIQTFGHMHTALRLPNASWGYHEVQMNQVLAWLLSQAVTEKLEAVFFRCVDSVIAAEISDSIQAKEWIRKRASLQ